MATLSIEKIGDLLAPFLEAPLPELCLRPEAGAPAVEAPRAELLEKLSAYLDLLVRWNARTNLTAVRDPEEMVTRHFGESLFAGRLLARLLGDGDRVLDFGSGAGFPGLPIKLLVPGLQVTLAESQGKKATFLREAQRSLGVDEVWGRRVEEMPADRRFEAVTLRAVDKMDVALEAAEGRVAPGGVMVVLASETVGESVAIPGSRNRFVDVRRF